MVLSRTVKDYLKVGVAANNKIDGFLDFCSMVSNGKKLHGMSATALDKTTSSSPNFIQDK